MDPMDLAWLLTALALACLVLVVADVLIAVCPPLRRALERTLGLDPEDD